MKCGCGSERNVVATTTPSPVKGFTSIQNLNVAIVLFPHHFVEYLFW